MRNQIRAITETAILVALATVFQIISETVPIMQMPQGGSITLALLPVMAIGFRRGFKYGLLGGTVFGVISWFLDGRILYLGSIFFDYIFVGMSFAVTGLFQTKKKRALFFLLAIFLGGLFKYLFHTLSGILFFAQYAPVGKSVIWYSVTYNFGYCAVSTFLAMVIGFALKDVITDLYLQ